MQAREESAVNTMLRMGGGCLLLVLVGCGSGTKLAGVVGTVALNGQPVESGVISFIPAQAGGDQVAVGTPIAKGTYELAAQRGLPPGTYRVEIRWPRPTGRTLPSPPGSDPIVETSEAIPRGTTRNRNSAPRSRRERIR